jgi:hypothetical protein
MALNISKMTAANKVLAGTVVGIPTTTQGTTVIPCTHSLTTNPNNTFTIRVGGPSSGTVTPRDLYA